MMDVSETIKHIAIQAALYGDEGEWDIDWPEDLEGLWDAWEQADGLRWAATQLKTHLGLRMEELVPDGHEVRLGDALWRYSTGGRWEAENAQDLIFDVLRNLGGDEAVQQIAALFSGFRVTALDAYAQRLGLEPAALRQRYATYKGGEERRLSPIPLSRAPQRASDYEHGEVH